ncbi:hypothetical protein CAEBREN_28530 [Caenorhabditis brenneri]|uniref:Uncharacterized protein n=1 Tax=Caenorhabditis brenneri TaxID=135651 RepID=G0MDM5_CAEBE|nr:hypothetical protein CAEBREN_28530 [Caenorhabditis brenneri]
MRVLHHFQPRIPFPDGRGAHAQRCGSECDSEPEFQFCCVKMGFCHWYQSWWFIYTSIGVGSFLLFVAIIITCYCCCNRSRRY